MEIILGDICYPKSKALIIPINSFGIISKGISKNIIDIAKNRVKKEIDFFVKNNNIKIEQCFSTKSGGLKRRGVDRIYYAVIKRLENDFTSISIVRKAINNALKEVVKDKVESVTICGIGISPGDIDKKTVAAMTVDICKRYDKKIKIKIIDNNEEFIREVKNLIKE